MTRPSRTTGRTSKTAPADPYQDPVGSFLVKQRPEVLQTPSRVPLPTDAAERITDASAIASLLASVSNMTDGAEDDLLFELLYLETLIAAQPLRSNELLEQLGELGQEVRDGLLPPGMINIVALRRRTQRLKQHVGGMAGRVSAAILMLFTALPLFGQQAAAAETETAHNSFQIAAAPVVRVIDAVSGQGLAGVTIKSMEEKVLGVTDASGQATLAEDYRDTDLMSLEKNGYELSLLERSQLAARNIVSMKPIKDNGAVAAKPNAMRAPAAPHAGTAPHVAMGANHTPTLEPPRPPSAPKAPQIRLPMKPRPMTAMTASRPAAKPHHQPAPVMAALPTHPRPMQLAAKPGPEGDAPMLPQPEIEKPRAPHAMAKPQLPSMHASTPHHAPHAAGAMMAAAPHAAHMNLPSHPRRPMQSAARPMPTHAEPVAVSVPKRVPRVAHAHTGHHHHHHASHMASLPMGRSSYQVKPGDTLSKLAQRYLGSAKRWPELYAMNRGRVHNPALIRSGQMLAVPMGGSYASGKSRTYVVRPGDSLFTIASEHLGNGMRWGSIYRMNRDHIQNARMIFPGQHLTLPV